MPPSFPVQDCKLQDSTKEIQDQEEEEEAACLYNEKLQERVYLSKVERGLGERCTELQPRTEQTHDAAGLFTGAASTAASWFSKAAETIADSLLVPKVQMLPVKRTFIHYDTHAREGETDAVECGEELPLRLGKSSSAPSVLLSTTFQIRQSMAELHMLGECSPCAYFYNKQDSCRLGDNCLFCHLCPVGEIKKRKKQKRKTLKDYKAQKRLEADSLLESASVADGTTMAPDVASDTDSE
jgi:hypothetical protein